MTNAERIASRRYLGDLISLLDRVREPHDGAKRANIENALAILRDKAFRGGASERTVGLIHAVQVVLALQAMPRGAGAPH